MSAVGKVRGEGAGFSLIEVVVATAVASVGILGAAGVVAAIGSQARRAGWDADRAVAARTTAQALVSAGFAAATSGSDTVTVGGRRYAVARVVTTRAQGLRHIALTITTPGGGGIPFEMLLARPRPRPAAP